MAKKYQPQTFEKHWQEQWEKEKTYKATASKKDKKYILDMFPYPSGAGLHVGHPRGYTATDILSRYYRMQGFDVLHPMGWDAFGLPAENAAIKAKTNPKKLVPQNIANFKRQMKMLGFSYDWDREFATTDPVYFKWTQWLFIQFFRMGLLYKKNTPINYCPSCKTGLAEEEVLPDGTHERCGNPITKKDLPQWIFRITKYADELIDSLDGLKWPKGILEMQRNWIGRKEGINITYKIEGTKESVTCFTTRPETNFGATFIVIAPEHELTGKIIDGSIQSGEITEKVRTEVERYVAQAKAKTELERISEGRKKTGAFTGLYALNNLNGNKIPLWVSDFVLKDFGTGAVVGVPGHDLRDFEFAQEFKLPVLRVVVSSDGDTSPIKTASQVQEEDGKMVNSEFLDGMDIHKAKAQIMDYLEEKGWGEKVVSYHLRDWIFSRQRYWGEPIPMVYCEVCSKNKRSGLTSEDQNLSVREKNVEDKINGWKSEVEPSMYGWYPISANDLPLDLPDVDSYEPLESGESPLAAIDSFVKTTCPNCGAVAKRETDTMPNWAGSCWYFLYFASSEVLNKSTLDTEPNAEEWQKLIGDASRHWLPVDWYVGGAEHAVLHLLYSRFWMHAMYDLGIVDVREPFMRLRNVGMILAEDNRKMSKSWGNVINPDDVVSEYGADSLRLYEMFMAPFSQEIAWSTRTLQGTYRFLKRVWAMSQLYANGDAQNMPENEDLKRKLHQTIDKVSRDIPDIKFNTAVAAMMEFLNEWEKTFNVNRETLGKEDFKAFLKILAPFAPYMTEEIWHTVCGEKTSIHLAVWPVADTEFIKSSDGEIPVQVNGKVRTIIKVPNDYGREKVLQEALKHEKVQKYVTAGKYKKVIFVPGKILNIIV
ncbi:leucine--tRNA ligase [Candidatus Roizmanbacteria bacterium]|nr:MAG: leucine--tRNA ligase [Candidatus Roizmanbacteria bacterium]